MAHPRIELVNHASVVVDAGDGTHLVSDPWLEGLTFNNGWELLAPTVFTPADFEGVTHLWISHEHPDHFHPPTLKRLSEAARARITVLYQSSPDLAAAREIQGFCRGLGFRDFVELPPDAAWRLGPETAVRCRHHLWGDSWSHLELTAGGRRTVVFNANDCEWESPEAAREVFDELGPVDVLLMQFSYACWYPDRAARRREADRLIDRLVMMTKESGARFVIPFASFVRFCHEDNVHMNDEVNTVHRAAAAVDRLTSARAVVLYPGDGWTLGEAPDNAAALRRYAADYERALDAAPLPAAPSVGLDVLRQKSAAFWQRNRRAGRDLPSGPDLRVYVKDLGGAVRWRGGDLLAADAPEGQCDLVLRSDSLAYLLDTRWGVGTLSVNARYQIPAASRTPTLIDFERRVVRALGRSNWLIAGALDTPKYGTVG